MMKRYWDLSETERAKLTYEQVEKFLAYELMEKGVLQVEPLVLEEVAPVELPKRRVFVLEEANGYGGFGHLDLAFDTIEQAEACRNAIRYIRESAWNEGAKTRPVRALQITAEELPSDVDVAARKAAIDEHTRREQANAKAKREHEEACKKIADATSGVWTDWHACRAAEARRQRIRDTFTEYARMTDGNGDLARAFLAKAFPVDEIEAAIGPMPPGFVKQEEAPARVAADDIPL